VGVRARRLSGAALVLEGSLATPLREDRSAAPQLLRLRVRALRGGRPDLCCRLRAEAVAEVRRKAEVLNPLHLELETGLVERFRQAFVEAVGANPRGRGEASEEPCMGCMAAPANVRLEKRCDAPQCAGCGCRPLWCVACVAQWFAHRQDPNAADTWLGSRAPCPTCRSPFCVLDVTVLE